MRRQKVRRYALLDARGDVVFEYGRPVILTERKQPKETAET